MTIFEGLTKVNTRDQQLAEMEIIRLIDGDYTDHCDVALPPGFFADLQYEYMGTDDTESRFDCHNFRVTKPGYKSVNNISIRKHSMKVADDGWSKFIQELIDKTFGDT